MTPDEDPPSEKTHDCRPPTARELRHGPDTVFSSLAHGAAFLTLVTLAGIIFSLFDQLRRRRSRSTACRSCGAQWDPVQNRYGGLVMIYGTLITSVIALIIAIP